jgi:hypothetical protein
MCCANLGFTNPPVCSFGQLQEYYIHHQLENYSKSTIA